MRVRWAEVDMQKIVFNAHYLMYFDTAMSDYWRAVAMPYEAAMYQLGGDIYLKKASVEYFASAHCDEQIDVGMKCARLGNSSIQFQGAIFRGDTLLVTGELLYVYADSTTQKSQPIPQPLRALFEEFEAAKPMVDLTVGPWQAVQTGVEALRRDVFVEEQDIATDLVFDAVEHQAVHASITNRLGQTIACGRLLSGPEGVARIGRMAVHRVLRGSGLGRDVLRALMDVARQRGDQSVLLHAQCSAQGFYERLGFVARGERYLEAGIDHIDMVMAL
jgi:YbgC/YbaW family acyl-CoA thioester hydrolase